MKLRKRLRRSTWRNVTLASTRSSCPSTWLGATPNFPRGRCPSEGSASAGGVSGRIGTTLILPVGGRRGGFIESLSVDLKRVDVAEDHAIGERPDQRDGRDMDHGPTKFPVAWKVAERHAARRDEIDQKPRQEPSTVRSR